MGGDIVRESGDIDYIVICRAPPRGGGSPGGNHFLVSTLV